LAIFVNCTGTAGRHTAAKFGSCEVQGISENPEQGHLRIDVDRDAVAIDIEVHGEIPELLS
jgi:hypothetical protein